jgi:hypothetical protein
VPARKAAAFFFRLESVPKHLAHRERPGTAAPLHRQLRANFAHRSSRPGTHCVGF